MEYPLTGNKSLNTKPGTLICEYVCISVSRLYNTSPKIWSNNFCNMLLTNLNINTLIDSSNLNSK